MRAILIYSGLLLVVAVATQAGPVTLLPRPGRGRGTRA
jgi:hypothetical protein